MSETGIFNAIIKNWDIRTNSHCMILELKFSSSIGYVDFSFNINYLQKICDILNITSVSQMIGKPCIIFVEDGLFRDMGSFLFHHYKEFEIEEERDSWLFYDNVKEYYKEQDKKN